MVIRAECDAWVPITMPRFLLAEAVQAGRCWGIAMGAGEQRALLAVPGQALLAVPLLKRDLGMGRCGPQTGREQRAAG